MLSQGKTANEKQNKYLYTSMIWLKQICFAGFSIEKQFGQKVDNSE
jgi:hypothetical protein